MTKDERAYVGAAEALGCALCRHLGLGESPAEYHHQRTGTGAGKRASHYRGAPLCPHHHRASNEALHVLGRKAWERRFGIEEVDLVAQTRLLLARLLPVED